MLSPVSGGYTLIGPSPFLRPSTSPVIQCDATNEAAIFIGRVITSDGGSHTIDTSGSSSIGWRTGSVTFSNGGTTLVVGIAPVDTSSGPPPRAVNSSNAISFDVSASYTGGGGGLSANSWVQSVPTSGSKTIANGDLVAIAVQMTARAGSDLVQVGSAAASDYMLRPCVTAYTGAIYAAQQQVPNCLITFSDGAVGWFDGGDVYQSVAAVSYNSGSSPNEYGQLYQLPFPVKVCGLYGIVSILASGRDFDVVLYSDPLGTPVAQRTVSIDGNTVASTGAFYFRELFATPYDIAANQPIGVVVKPGASSVSAYSKTLNNAAHRIADLWGTSGYGISRSSGAFSNINSSLDHLYVGMIVSAFDGGGGGGVSRARAFGGV